MPKTDTKPTQKWYNEIYPERVALKKRKPTEWLTLIKRIKDPAERYYVASVVWWDYFGYLEVADAWPHLDEITLQDPPNDVPDLVIEAHLLSLGYGVHDSKRRAKTPKSGKTKRTTRA